MDYIFNFSYDWTCNIKIEIMLSKTFIKKILIYGLGLSGNACLKHLKKNDVKVFDDNFSLKIKKIKSFFEKSKILKLEFDYIVLSPE